VAIDAVLADQDEGFGHSVEPHCQASAPGTQHLLVMLKLCFMLVESGHRWLLPQLRKRISI
jgi:hypothetical protein